jgi:putative flippase GtrA
MQDIIAQFTSSDAGPVIQFIKYAIAGGVATFVDIVVFYTLAWKVFPALNADDVVVRILKLSIKPVDELTRSRRFVIITAIAFFFSNLTAYLINVAWVFEAGRHAWWIEIGLFYAVSGISIVLGTFLGWVMIRFMHLSTTSSYIGKMIAALLINFVCRKFFIFKG